MRRNVLLISAAVTTFSVVLLASVVYAYQAMAASPSATIADSGQAAAVAQSAVSVAADPASAPNVSPQEAAAAAATFMNRKDALSVELTVFDGSQAYKVTFSSGDIAYVSLSGQVLATLPSPVAAVSFAPIPRPIGVHGGGHASSHHGGGGGGEGGGDGGGGDGGGGGGD